MILVWRALLSAQDWGVGDDPAPTAMLGRGGQDETLQWRHNGCDGVSNHQPHDRLLNRLFRRRSKKTSKLRVTGICAGNSPVTDEFPAQMASNAENVSIWWRLRVFSNSTHMNSKPSRVHVNINRALNNKIPELLFRLCLEISNDPVAWISRFIVFKVITMFSNLL